MVVNLEVMTCVTLPRKKAAVPFVSLYFILLFCCHVSCVLISVTRNNADIFSYSGISTACFSFCQEKDSFFHTASPTRGICTCQCSSDHRTFIIAESKCIADRTVRDTTETFLKFQLVQFEQPEGALAVISLDSNINTIQFYVQGFGDKKCTLNDVEELSLKNFKQWNSVKHLLDDVYVVGAVTVTLKWKNVNPAVRFASRVLRLNVTCTPLIQGSSITGLMVFKVNGTFTVPQNAIASFALAPSIPTMYYLSSTRPSDDDTVSANSRESSMLQSQTISEGFISLSPSKTTSANSIDLSSSQTTSASFIGLSSSKSTSTSSIGLSSLKATSSSSIGLLSSQPSSLSSHGNEIVYSNRGVLIASAVGNGVLIVMLFIILLVKYKPRKTTALPTSAKKSIEAVETTQESLPNDKGLDCENITVVVQDFYDDVYPTSPEGGISIYEDVRITSGVAKSSTHSASSYEEVCEPRFAWETNAPCKEIGYTELDILKREATDDYGYQGLLKENVENVTVAIAIPNDNQHQSYEVPKILPRNPGYTDLDRNKKISDEDCYQKLPKRGKHNPTGERRELPAVGLRQF